MKSGYPLSMTTDHDFRAVTNRQLRRDAFRCVAPAGPIASLLGSQVHPDDAARLLATHEKIYARGGLQVAGTFRLKSIDGARAHVDLVANNQLADPDIVGVILNGGDVTQEVTHLLTIGPTSSRTIEFRDPLHRRSPTSRR